MERAMNSVDLIQINGELIVTLCHTQKWTQILVKKTHFYMEFMTFLDSMNSRELSILCFQGK